MIRYEQFAQLRHLLDVEHCSPAQGAQVLGVNIKTALSWASRKEYTARQSRKRPSQLDTYKGDIVRRLYQHPYSARQILNQLREQGYTGGYSILTEFIRQVRPRHQPAFLTLHFEPGECAQVDWGYAGILMVGATRRRLSFLVMVLGHSRRMYVEFTLTERLEQFLSCQQNAFTQWGGAPKKLMVDNLKSAVLSHPGGQPAVYNPYYLDFAGHYGCELRACNVRAAHEKGRVENGVGYVKKNFLNGMELSGSLAGINAAAWRWLDEVANVRIHGETRRRPIDWFAEEKPALLPLPVALYDVGRTQAVHATRRFRVHFDGNRYSVPSEYAGSRLNLLAYPDRLLIYHQQKLIAEHVRKHERGANVENPDHVRALLAQRPRAQEQKILQRFLQLTPLAEEYYRQLEQRRVHARLHVRKIVALSEIHGAEAVVRALTDTHELQAYSSEYIANLLEQRRRFLPEPGALHLTRGQDLLDLDLPEANLDLYEHPSNGEKL
jgi:transposase